LHALLLSAVMQCNARPQSFLAAGRRGHAWVLSLICYFSASGLRRLSDESGAGMNGGRSEGFRVSWWPQLPARDVSASLQKTSFPAVIKQRLQDKTGGSTHSETRSTLPPARFSGFPQERHGWALGPCCFPFCFPLLSLSAPSKNIISISSVLD
jgi:hypothetical protein